jgi:transposase-like protein
MRPEAIADQPVRVMQLGAATPIFSNPVDNHKAICTTSAVESVNMPRKFTKNCGSFPTRGGSEAAVYGAEEH